MANESFKGSAEILRQLYLLRIITIGFFLMMALIAIFALNIDLPVLPLSLILLFMVVINFFTRLLLNANNESSLQLIFIQLLLEIISFSLILFYTGGATNPFTFFYLIPLAISATVIPGKRTWILTSLTVILYSLLLKFYVPLSYRVHNHQAMEHDGQFSQHVLGMWFGFLGSAVLVTWFITYLAKELKQRELDIAEAKQRELRDQQMVTLGTLAAGTAHDLGTPLASLAIIAGDITDGYTAESDPELFENQGILREQIQRCKKILSVLSENSGESRADEGHLVTVKNFVDSVLTDWLEQHPASIYQSKLESLNSQLKIIYDKTISQALINLLNNALDESSESIRVITDIDQKDLLIVIIDRGFGITEKQIEMAGEISFSNKPDGMGIGLLLAITTIRRSGGSVDFHHRKSGGTRTRVRLPLIECRS